VAKLLFARHAAELALQDRPSGQYPESQTDTPTDGQWTVGLVDDDAIVRAWVRLALRDSEFHVAGEAGTAEGALLLLERRRPSLLLIDYRLPDQLATDFVRTVRREGWTTPVLIITASPEPGLNEAVLEAGAQGVVIKRGDPIELLQVLRQVVAGEPVLDAEHPRRAPGQATLSPREREVLRLAAGGSTNQEIARELEIGSETVKTMLSRIFGKLGARNRMEAVTTARERGII
jgi:two-component system response regulator DesR